MSALDHTESAGTAQPPSSARSIWALAILTVTYVVAFIDRQLLNLLLIPIQQFHHLSDTAMGVLIGAAFTITYVVMGIPVGLWMDRGTRRNLMVAGGVAWCLGTTLMAWAGSFVQLFVARLCVGGAEATMFPGGSSLIAGYFRREQLPRAMSIFLLAPFIGGGLALIFGGLLIAAAGSDTSADWLHFPALAPWQRVFALIGIAGLAPILLLLTLREPPRAPTTATRNNQLSPAATRRFFAQRWRFYAPFYLGVGVGGVLSYGIPAWAPTFLIRQYAQTPRSVGVSYGAVTLVFGICGVLAGPSIGRLCSRSGSIDGMMRAMSCTLIVCVPVCAALPFVHSYLAAIAILATTTFLYTAPISIAAAALQLATPDRMRGAAAALYLIVVALIGGAGGPLLVSLISRAASVGIGTSLGVVCATAAVVAAALSWSAESGYVELLQAQAA